MNTKYESSILYLQSKQWIALKDSIINAKCTCQVCDVLDASDVHHLIHTNPNAATLHDVIPVCKDCHNYIHEAIANGWISRDHKFIKRIKKLTFSIRKNNRYERWKAWYTNKTLLSDKQISIILACQPFVIKRINSLVKQNVWYDNLHTVYFSGKQQLQIRNIIQTALYRKGLKVNGIVKRYLKYEQ